MINACREHRYLHVFSRRTAIRKEMYDKVVAEWTALGLDGEPPRLLAFHTDDKRRALVEAQELDKQPPASGQSPGKPDAKPDSPVVNLSM